MGGINNTLGEILTSIVKPGSTIDTTEAVNTLEEEGII